MGGNMIAYLRRKVYKETDETIMRHDDIFPVLYDEIEFRNDGIFVRDVNLSTMDLFYFRAVGNAYEAVNRLIHLAKAHNIPIIDKHLYEHGARPRTKYLMHVDLSGFARQPNYSMFQGDVSHAYGRAEMEGIGYPFIVKVSKGGRQGMGTFLVNGRGDINRIRLELERRHSEREGHTFNLGDCEWIVQEYIPNRGDYRAFVIGEECIGITKRGPKQRGLVMNESERGSRRFRNGRWPRDVGRLAVEASNVMEIDIAGVDIVRHDATGELYVIEVNEAPRFKSFARATRIDVGERIVHYLRRRADARTQD